MAKNSTDSKQGDASLCEDASRPSTDFQGYVDEFDPWHIAGWVWNRAAPETLLEVELLCDGTVVAEARANRFRGDLAANGIGSGFHGFRIASPVPLSPEAPVVRVRETGWTVPLLAGLEPGAGAPPTAEETPRDRARCGFVELVAPHLVRGWACDPDRPGTAVRVSIFHGDELLATGLAEEVRDDLADVGGREFVIGLPRHGATRPQDLRCFAELGGGLLALPGARAPEPDTLWGGFDIVAAATVVGWVAREAEADAAPDVEVLANGEVVWRGPARRLMGEHPIGFRVDLPPPVDWQGEMEVAARLANGGTPIGHPVRVRPIDRFAGHIDSCTFKGDSLVLSGWVSDKARPLDSLQLALHVDGAPVAAAMADEYRADLKALGFVTARHGFTISHPWRDEQPPERLSLAIADIEAPVFPDIAIEAAEPAAAGDVSHAAAPDLRSCTVDGSVDLIRYWGASGWARYREAPDEPVLLDLYIDNCYFFSTLTGRHRADVAKKFGDEGNHGFVFDFPPHMTGGQDIEFRVVPRHGKNAFSSGSRVVRRCPNGQALNAVPVIQPSARAGTHASPTSALKVAYIVLNLNGESLLDELFESFARHNHYDNYEFLIVDHGSSDGSLRVCEKWSQQLNIRIFARGENHSFSASNNYGASNTDAEVLVFLNNDIVFTQDVATELVRLLEDDSIGSVGIKLLDRPSESAYSTAPIQHLGVHFSWMHREILAHPFETRYAPHLCLVANDLFDVPAVTGALVACRRSEFLELGGFDEGYYYGYEDVDLCLRQVLDRGKRVVCANHLVAYHARGYSRGKAGDSLTRRLAGNRRRLQEKFGSALRRRQSRDRFERPGYWTSMPPCVAFAVTEASDTTEAGDYFTAMELARELVTELACQVIFLDKRVNWYDLAGVDVLITMREDYDFRRIHNAAPHLLKIGWARNWIDRWAGLDWAQDYDVMWASSQKAADHLSTALARPVEVVRIATWPARFQAGCPRPELASDYCFTGSYFSAPREILYHLDPSALPFDFGLFGHGWQAVPQFAPFSRGPVPYSSMPDVYASTKIVIDDANSATKRWGSVNSRVYDALAAGALVITNGREGAEEVFGGRLPTYASSQELEHLLWKYLKDDDARTSLVAELQATVQDAHTYRHRAAQVGASLRAVSRTQLRFAVKIGTPRAELCEEWGDYHFASGLKRALTRLGHTVRIDCLDRWRGDHCLGDDVVIVLRGLSAYEPEPHQINLMWNISHPDAVSRAEYEKYDHVFVASTLHAKRLAEELDVPVTPLLQCTDAERFHPDVAPLQTAPEFLFVGNSRGVYRDIVRHAVELGLPLEVHGTLWEGLVPPAFLRSRNLPNQELARHYKSARAVLNDHWGDMRKHGFISNRLFDAAAAGAFIITDEVAGLGELFGESVYTVRSREDLAGAARFIDKHPRRVRDMRRGAQKIVHGHHTFDARAREICRTVEFVATRTRSISPALGFAETPPMAY